MGGLKRADHNWRELARLAEVLCDAHRAARPTARTFDSPESSGNSKRVSLVRCSVVDDGVAQRSAPGTKPRPIRNKVKNPETPTAVEAKMA